MEEGCSVSTFHGDPERRTWDTDVKNCTGLHVENILEDSIAANEDK